MFPILFVIDLVLGFGTHLIDIPFLPAGNLMLALASLYLFVLILALKENPFSLKDNAVLKSLKWLDLIVFLFAAVNMVWVIIVPYAQGFSLREAIKEGVCFLALFLYFPLALLVRLKKLSLNKTYPILARTR